MQPVLLEQHLIPISVLGKHPRNYKHHPESQLAKIRASLKRFGQVKPVLVRSECEVSLNPQHWTANHVTYTIIAGHGVCEAAEQLGWPEIVVAIAPQEWTQADALAYLIADNETSNDAEINELMLAELLEESKQSGYELEALGSSEEELHKLLAKLADEQLELYKQDTAITDDDLQDNPLSGNTTTCPNCGHIF